MLLLSSNGNQGKKNKTQPTNTRTMKLKYSHAKVVQKDNYRQQTTVREVVNGVTLGFALKPALLNILH